MVTKTELSIAHMCSMCTNVHIACVHVLRHHGARAELRAKSSEEKDAEDGMTTGGEQGKLEDNTFVVLDAFALPVEGTETRVTALEEGYEYMVGYQTTCEASGRVEPVIGSFPPTLATYLPSFPCLVACLQILKSEGRWVRGDVRRGEKRGRGAERHVTSDAACLTLLDAPPHRLVPQPPWLWLLAIRHRREHAVDAPGARGPIPRHCGGSGARAPAPKSPPSAAEALHGARVFLFLFFLLILFYCYHY